MPKELSHLCQTTNRPASTLVAKFHISSQVNVFRFITAGYEWSRQVKIQ